MKHGDKTKRKAASKASGKKSSKAKISAKSKKAAPVVKAKKQTTSSKTQKQVSSSKSGGNGKPRPRLTTDQLTFSNPIVAAAFKRAIKKYPNAFRRLTD
ncbi:MAG TPA: hypothetical protein VGS96_04760 [Thermoanaerobaculia bacterium]|jgi:hypothetical protein|nr:hypothetical protein [Thermoanaerobaculia bacterium]